MASGRSRRPTTKEAQAATTVLLPNAVVQLAKPAAVGTEDERAVAAAIDGWRPIARVRMKSRLSPAAFRAALAALASQGCLRVVAIIEGRDELAGLADLDGVRVHGDETMRRQEGAVIPPSVMAEIEAMVEEDARVRDDFDEDTDATLRLVRPRRS
jgi:hypothetical protein